MAALHVVSLVIPGAPKAREGDPGDWDEPFDHDPCIPFPSAAPPLRPGMTGGGRFLRPAASSFQRHCEEHSDEAAEVSGFRLPGCFAALARTDGGIGASGRERAP